MNHRLCSKPSIGSRQRSEGRKDDYLAHRLQFRRHCAEGAVPLYRPKLRPVQIQGYATKKSNRNLRICRTMRLRTDQERVILQMIIKINLSSLYGEFAK